MTKLGRCSSIALNSFRAYYYYGLSLSAVRQLRRGGPSRFEVALDLEPQDLQALIAAADAQLNMGDVDEARAGYARALQLRAAHAPALDGMGRTYEAQANDKKAEELYRQTILSNPGHAPAYTHLGDLYMRNDRVREAVRLLEEAVTIRPDFAEGLNRLAVAYGRLGMHHEAVATVQRAIELDPVDPRHPQTLGLLLLDQGMLSAAARSLSQALDRDDRLIESRVGLARIARRRGDYELALLEIDAALRLPELDGATVGRLEALRQAVQDEELHVAELEASVASGEAAAEDFGALVDVLARRGRWGDAAELLRLTPPSPHGDELMAYLLFRDGQYRSAYAIYSGLADSLGGTALQLNAGVALALLGNDAAAMAVYDGILEAEPHHVTARLYLANAQLRLGRIEAAATNYRAFLDAGGVREAAERVRRILKQIAPELAPAEEDTVLPAVRPSGPEDGPEPGVGP